MRTRTAFFSALCLGATWLGLPAAAQPVIATYYYPSGGTQAALQRPSVQKLTHLIYSFVPVCGDSPAFDAEEKKVRDPICAGVADYAITLPDTPQIRAELTAIAELKQRNPGLKIIASVGGWGMPMYPEVVVAPERRKAFTDSAVALLTKYPVFDGLDIDWEYPGGGDEARAPLSDAGRMQEAADHRALVETLRGAFDGLEIQDGRERLLTTAVAGYPRSVAGIDWKGVEDDFDLVFVMTYDFTPEKSFERIGDYSGGGGWPGHHTNLVAGPSTEGYGSDAMIRNLAAAGVPKAKMVLGAGFYAREWKNAHFEEGRFPASGSSGELAGMASWTEVQARELEAKGWTAGYDETAEAAYFHDPKTGGFLSLDTPRTLAAKGRYVQQEGLAGLFAWELSQDDGTLVEAMATAVAKDAD
ncbi:chitinase A [Asticcacaulis biprosthecium C19]|uniref:chitinase n=1 Tax=Asticcacaulis biprosthecium C19 TaxID=715226 RepID=F4QLP1_9CAUL|nr:glycosyl hydrolase family 18 protein [Asticcacaulis biprosthecium]EGF93539.1 chitinase A [Asticcacaulis biprosthecium C19]